MATPIKYSHQRPDLVAADRGIFRNLHVEDAITGVVVGLPLDATFNNVTVNTSLTLGGPTVSTAPITTSDDIFCRNLTASQTVTGATVVATNAAITTVTNTPTFAAGALIAPAQTLDISSASIVGTGTAQINIAGDITTTSGVLTAPTAAIATVSSNTVFSAGATIAPSQTLTINNASITGTGTATITVQGNITTLAGTLTAPAATLPAISGVVTINGSPYPPTSTVIAAGGPLVDVVVGQVFPTLTVPLGGTGAYRVTDASLAGMANNAADPGAGNGGPAAGGLAFITGFNGDISGRTELLLWNASSYVLAFAAPITSINTARGRVWFPGARARATRPTALTATWVIEVDDLRFESRQLESAANFTGRIDAGTATVDAAGFEYTLHGFSDPITDDLLCVVSGFMSVRLDRTAAPGPATATIKVTFPVGENASGLWSALPGFLPPFGTLDELMIRNNAGAFELESGRNVGVGNVWNLTTAGVVATLRTDTGFTIDFNISNIAGVTDVLASAAFRFLFDRYAYVATF